MLLAIPPPPTNAVELGPLTIHLYGIAIATGAILAVLLIRRRWSALGGDPDLIDRVALWAVIAGLLGARLAFVSTNLDRFADRPLAILAVWEGGLAFFGGLLLGACVALWYARRAGAPLPAFADAAIVGVPLAQAIGRWGNYFNQELYGTTTTLPWALEIADADGQVISTVHPTFLYESLWNLALVALLIAIGARRVLRQGSLVFLYLIGYGSARFALELIRTDTEFRLLGISRNGYVALLAVVGGLVALTWWQRREPRAPRTATPITAGAAETDDATRPPASSGDEEPTTPPGDGHDPKDAQGS